MTQSYIFIASIIVFVFIISKLINLFTPKIKGYIGESSVIHILSRLPSEQYRVLNNIMLRTNNGTTQIDHIVVSLYGIFVIETKNYKGIITGGEFSETWTKTMYGKKYTFRNPLKQNYGHVKALATLLEFTDDKFIPIVVFSASSTIKVKSNKPVMYVSKLQKHIESFNQNKLTTFELDEVVEKIQSSNIDSKEMRKQHKSSIRENIKSNNINIAKGICPKCGGTLVERTGKYGSFIGCSNYPKCRYTSKK